MKSWLRVFAAAWLGLVSSWVQAHDAGMPAPTPRNIVQLSASATVEVPQDWLTMTLGTSREGPDAGIVQAQLTQALDEALRAARKRAQEGLLEVHTGTFHLSPRYSKEGRITGWQGRTELVLEGRDFTRIAALAGTISSLSIGGVQFSLSRAAQNKVEGQAQTMAIDRFKAKADAIAKGFGFTSYALQEVSVHANDQGGGPPPRMLAMQAKSAVADAPVPLEAGKSAVVVSVSGSVQLQ